MARRLDGDAVVAADGAIGRWYRRTHAVPVQGQGQDGHGRTASSLGGRVLPSRMKARVVLTALKRR